MVGTPHLAISSVFPEQGGSVGGPVVVFPAGALFANDLVGGPLCGVSRAGTASAAHPRQGQVADAGGAVDAGAVKPAGTGAASAGIRIHRTG